MKKSRRRGPDLARWPSLTAACVFLAWTATGCRPAPGSRFCVSLTPGRSVRHARGHSKNRTLLPDSWARAAFARGTEFRTGSPPLQPARSSRPCDTTLAPTQPAASQPTTKAPTFVTPAWRGVPLTRDALIVLDTNCKVSHENAAGSFALSLSPAGTLQNPERVTYCVRCPPSFASSGNDFPYLRMCHCAYT